MGRSQLVYPDRDIAMLRMETPLSTTDKQLSWLDRNWQALVILFGVLFIFILLHYDPRW